MDDSIFIIGGGVAGLTIAHELSQKTEKEIVILEKRKHLGGKSRSFKESDNGTEYFAEHGLHFFASFYNNLFSTLKEIPYSEATVFDNLVSSEEDVIMMKDQSNIKAPLGSIYSFNGIKETVGWGRSVISKTSPGELLFFFDRLTRYYFSNDEQKHQQITWEEYLELDDRSDNFTQIFGYGPTKGLAAINPDEISAKAVLKVSLWFLRDAVNPSKDIDRVLNGPLNETWISPWREYLEDQGVVIKTETAVEAIEIDDGKVKKLVTDEEEFKPDTCFLATSVEAANYLINEESKQRYNLEILGELSDQIEWMNGIQFHVNRKIPGVKGHILYTDSDWEISSISVRDFWKEKYFQGNVEDIVSIVISDWNQPGTNGLEAKKCTPEKLVDETLRQINEARKEELKIKEEDIEKVTIDRELEIGGKTVSESLEPLFVNNYKTETKQPDNRTDIKNLYLAGDYTATSVMFGSMEAANESGKMAVNRFLEDRELEANKIGIYRHSEMKAPKHVRDTLEFFRETIKRLKSVF